MRATVMAGMVLVGRLFGFALEAWQLLVGGRDRPAPLRPPVSPSTSVSNSRWRPPPAFWSGPGGRPDGSVWRRALAVTLGAQVAVAPLLVLTFEHVPLLSPLVNLVAAPMVARPPWSERWGSPGSTPLVSVAAFAGRARSRSGRSSSLAAGGSGWRCLGVGACATSSCGFDRKGGWCALVGALALVLTLVARDPRRPMPEWWFSTSVRATRC